MQLRMVYRTKEMKLKWDIMARSKFANLCSAVAKNLLLSLSHISIVSAVLKKDISVVKNILYTFRL